MSKMRKETTDRAKAWKCVRFDDNMGFKTKFNKTHFQDESRKETYHYSVKFVEQGMRGFSPIIVAKEKFQKFRKVSEGLKLEPLPEGFQSLTHKKKREAVDKLVDKVYNELAAAMSRGPVQGVHTQADDSGTLQVGAGSAPQFNKTAREDVDMQVNNLGQIQVDEVWAAAPDPDLGSPLSNYASLQKFAWNQCDNSQGWPPSRNPVLVDDIVLFFDHLMVRASRFPEIWPKFEWSKEAFRSFVTQLELLEGAFKDRSSLHFRSRQEEFYAPLADVSACEDVTNLPSLESLAGENWNNLYTSPGRPEAPGSSPNVFTG